MGFRVQAFGIRTQGLGFREFRVWGAAESSTPHLKLERRSMLGFLLDPWATHSWFNCEKVSAQFLGHGMCDSI